MRLRYLIAVIVSAICVLLNTSVLAEDKITVTINNKELISSTSPIVVDGRTLVPLRAICEAMECEVIWVSSTETANIKNKTNLVSMQIGSIWVAKKKLIGNGQPIAVQIDVPPMLYEGVTYVPARALAEALDAVVGWDEVSRTVMIVYDTSLKYNGSMQISHFAGTGERQRHDGSTYQTTSFVSPEAIDVSDDGKIYVGDSGCIRILNNGECSTVELEPSYLTVDLLRCSGNDVYALTHEFKDSNDVKYFGLVKISGNNAEGLFITEAAYSKITDFTFDANGRMYVLQNNVGVGANYLGQMDVNTGKVTYLTEVDNGITCLCTDSKGHIFMGNSTKGSLYRYDIASGQMKLFAGVDDNIKFVDGPNAMFVEPRRMEYSDGYVYVLDYNIIRRISVDTAAMAITTESIAGKLSVEMNPDTADGKASEAQIAPSYLMDFVVNKGKVIMTDPKNAVLRIIE